MISFRWPMLRSRLKILREYIYGCTYFFIYHIGLKREINDKITFINIAKNPYKRYLYLLIKFFQIEGHTVYLKRDFRLLYALKKEPSLHFLFVEKLIRFATPPKGSKYFVLDESLLSPDYFSDTDCFKNADQYKVPMSQHPLMYHTGWWNETITMEERKRTLFMAGNFDAEIYSVIDLEAVFPIISRIGLLNYFTEKQLLFNIQNLNDIQTFFNTSVDNKIILIDRLKLDIPMAGLRPLLAKFDFFFALPGICMPFSHNIIEAMSVGCISFIQESYARLFHPPLLDGIQVITFNGFTDIEDRLNVLFALQSIDINRMRQHVVEYYQRYLIPGSVVNRMVKSDFKIIYLQAERISVDLMRK